MTDCLSPARIEARSASKGFWPNPSFVAAATGLQSSFLWLSIAVTWLLGTSSGCAPIANFQFDVPSPDAGVMWPDGESCGCGDACEPVGETDEQCVDQASLSDESLGVHLVSYSTGVVQMAAETMLSAVGTAGAAVGSVANYFIPVSQIAPPDAPRPGQFHPVPTTPVFAPRL